MERELRTYQHVAQQSHYCDRCCGEIIPGELYEGRVVVTDLHGLLVWKTHIDPSCDFPEEPEYTEGVQRSRSAKDISTTLKKAA